MGNVWGAWWGLHLRDTPLVQPLDVRPLPYSQTSFCFPAYFPPRNPWGAGAQLPGPQRRWVSFLVQRPGNHSQRCCNERRGRHQPLCPALRADRRNYFYPALLLTDLAFCSAGWSCFSRPEALAQHAAALNRPSSSLCTPCPPPRQG